MTRLLPIAVLVAAIWLASDGHTAAAVIAGVYVAFVVLLLQSTVKLLARHISDSLGK